MRLRAWALCALLPLTAAAGQDDDLDRIPQAVLAPPLQAPPAPPPSKLSGRLSVDDAVSGSIGRENLVVPSPGGSADGWENRTSVDGLGNWEFSPRLSASLSDRLDLEEQKFSDAPSKRVFHNDFLEGYLAWEPLPQLYAEAGRINLRNGVALGFNPVDFFKTRTGIDLSSADPSTIRNNRLGAVMARLQYLWDGGAVSLAAAPRLEAPSPLASAQSDGFNGRFDRTNSADRYLLSLSASVGDLSPRVFAEHESGSTRYGFDLSHAIGQSIVVYAEWAGGEQGSVAQRAVDFGQSTGTLPQAAPVLQGAAAGNAFRNDVAAGGSWTAQSAFSVNLEYHYHQSGYTRQDWRHAFLLGGMQPATIGEEFWYVREYANAQEEPMSRGQWFVRLDQTDAFIRNLELSGFAFVNAGDGSVFGQLSANYDWTNHWSFAAYASGTPGSSRSEYGSLPQAAAVAIQAIRYF